MNCFWAGAQAEDLVRHPRLTPVNDEALFLSWLEPNRRMPDSQASLLLPSAMCLTIAAASVNDCFNFRRITPGIEALHASFSLPRHRHLRGYATVVLAGTLEESGYIGRIQATAGDVLVHPALDCHANPRVSAGLKLIRLRWTDSNGLAGLYRLDEVDALARTA